MLTLSLITMIVLLFNSAFPRLVPLWSPGLMFCFWLLDNEGNVGAQGPDDQRDKAGRWQPVPLFIFCCRPVTVATPPTALLDLVQTFVGHLRGGLPITTAAGARFGARLWRDPRHSRRDGRPNASQTAGKRAIRTRSASR